MSSDPALLKKGYPGVEIQPGASIVGNCRINPGCQIGSQVVIAQEVVVCTGAWIYGEVVLERDVKLPENITLVGPLRVVKAEGGLAGALTEIHEGAVIGKNAEILGGVSIGQFARIRAKKPGDWRCAALGCRQSFSSDHGRIYLQ